jgi:hypothetical protein
MTESTLAPDPADERRRIFTDYDGEVWHVHDCRFSPGEAPETRPFGARDVNRREFVRADGEERYVFVLRGHQTRMGMQSDPRDLSRQLAHLRRELESRRAD